MNKIIKELFEENINPIIRLINAIREELFEIGIVDSQTAACDDIIKYYNELIIFCNEKLDIIVAKETREENIQETIIKEKLEALQHFSLPQTRKLDEFDASIFNTTLKQLVQTTQCALRI